MSAEQIVTVENHRAGAIAALQTRYVSILVDSLERAALEDRSQLDTEMMDRLERLLGLTHAGGLGDFLIESVMEMVDISWKVKQDFEEEDDSPVLWHEPEPVLAEHVLAEHARPIVEPPKIVRPPAPRRIEGPAEPAAEAATERRHMGRCRFRDGACTKCGKPQPAESPARPPVRAQASPAAQEPRHEPPEQPQAAERHSVGPADESEEARRQRIERLADQLAAPAPSSPPEPEPARQPRPSAPARADQHSGIFMDPDQPPANGRGAMDCPQCKKYPWETRLQNVAADSPDRKPQKFCIACGWIEWHPARARALP